MSDEKKNPPDPEAELERFRAQWRNEVSARNRKLEPSHITRANLSQTQSSKDVQFVPIAGPSISRKKDVIDHNEDVEPHAYHDLPDKDEYLKLNQTGQPHDRITNQEPSSALEHYERAVEKETQGQLGDSLRHYRTAFKLDDGVHEAYKKKHFPPSSFKSKPQNTNPSNAAVTVPGTGHHSLTGSSGALSHTLQQLVLEFADSRIEPAPPPTSASPEKSSPLGQLPEELLIQILESLAVTDVASFGRVSMVCRRLAYLVLTEESIWKQVALDEASGFPAMHYDFVCTLEGSELETDDHLVQYFDSFEIHELEKPPVTPQQKALAASRITENLLNSTYSSSWRQMFRSRPRIRFNGCYISTVNYIRPGGASFGTTSWNAPVHVVTYFRYLRFFRDGTAISLLTTSEPADVVHHLIKDNLHDHHGNYLPSSVMKDALKGRWRLSGPASSQSNQHTGEREIEGDVHIETEGAVAKYTFKMLLALSHAGKRARNNKLAWKGFWSHNRLTDDWGEFGLKNDQAFYWSRVKSYVASAQ